MTERQEAELIRQIKLPIAQTIYQRYNDLIARRDQHQLTVAEHAELLQLTDEIELFDAKRAELLITLAQIRQKPLEDVMAALGVNQHRYG